MIGPMPNGTSYFSRRFAVTVVILVLVYCTLQVLYVTRLPVVMDEFSFAYEAYRLRHATPYRDFVPYKTVLGYYVETLGTFAASDVWSRILTIKLEIVAINGAMLIAATIFLSRHLNKRAVLLALVLLLANTAFLERSSELRVDMLTAWAGLWSLLFLLSRRPGWAGVLCAASFLISQKGAFYVVAGNAAIVACWLYERTRRGARELVVFNVVAAGTLALYIVFWSSIGSLSSVIHSTFIAAADTALLSAYDIRGRYWSQVLIRNPLYFALGAVAVAVLAHRWWARKSAVTEVVVLVYSAAVLFLSIIHRQPWPYFFVLLLPTMFVLHATWFSAQWPPRLLLLAIAIIGVFYPLTRVWTVLHRDNSYQRYNVGLAKALLEPADTYLAGADIIHDREQSLRSLSWLDAVILARLSSQPETVHRATVAQLEQSPPKLFIGNYRIYRLPLPFLEFIDRYYTRLSGSIWIYSPMIEAGQTTGVRIAFDGRYRVESQSGGNVTIDGKQYTSGDYLTLTSGLHAVSSRELLRLRLLPLAAENMLDPKYVSERDFYPNVYDY